MVTITALWMAIIGSAILTWIAYTLIWMLTPWHKKDYRGLPGEDAFLDALREQGLSAGQYDFPHLQSRDELATEDKRRLFIEGPAGFVTIVPRGLPRMGKAIVLSGLFYLFVGLVIAYVASRTLPSGADYLGVFRLTGTIAWIAYCTAVVPDAVWFGRPWSSVVKICFDALIAALLTAGVFAALWPG